VGSTLLISGHAMKSVAAAFALVSVLAWMPAAAQAATGSIRITITRAQFIVGGGDGTLHFKGRRYPLRVGGACKTRRIFTASIRRSLKQGGQEHFACETGKASFWNCAGGAAPNRPRI